MRTGQRPPPRGRAKLAARCQVDAGRAVPVGMLFLVRAALVASLGLVGCQGLIELGSASGDWELVLSPQGGEDLLIAKLAAEGSILLLRSGGNPSHDRRTAIAAHRLGGVTVAGYFGNGELAFESFLPDNGSQSPLYTDSFVVDVSP